MGNKRAGGTTRVGACALAALVMSAGAWGQQVPPTPPSVLPPSDYGHQFVTIGAPGNRAALASERFYNIGHPNLGAVGYEYRMARTEVTVQQYAAFVNAYAPFFEAANPGHTLAPEFTGRYIRRATLDPTAPPVYVFEPGAENLATDMSWRMAARYCNWLHNGRPTGGAITQNAFERGAYDTATFTTNPDFTHNDQAMRSPGALFWIPSLDEWTKAAHYDPNRYGPGPGQDGYWKYQAGQDTELTPGPPGQGQTNAGAQLPSYDVGAYPNVLSPWDLLDTSGGVSEHTEERGGVTSVGTSRTRVIRGAAVGGALRDDVIDELFKVRGPNSTGTGLRIASSVPSPGAAPIVFLIPLVARRRR